MTDIQLEESPQEEKKTLRTRIKELLLWLFQLGIAMLIVSLINSFVVRSATVNGNSMYPTLSEGDMLLIRMIAYTPEPGDIIVCEAADDSDLAGKHVVKRCIATEGQTVFIDYDHNTVSVDGIALNEPYINFEDEDPLDSGGRENVFYLVPEGCVFVLGDNRNDSADSRSDSIGMVPEDAVMGGMMVHIPFGAWFADK